MSRPYLVTGAAGLIGFEVVQQLLGTGAAVFAIDHGGKYGLAELEALAKRHAGRLTVLSLDLAAEALQLPPGVQGPFAAVLHFAAIVGVRAVSEAPWLTLDVNLRSTLNTLALAKRHGTATFFFASSSECYAGAVDAGVAAVPTSEGAPLYIADPALPRWSYAASKIAGEAATFAMAREAPFVPVVARFHNVYGPRMGLTHVIPELLERCRLGETPLRVFGPEQSRSFLYVEDAGRAVLASLAAAERGDGGLVHLGCDVETPIAALAALICDVSGHRVPLQAEPAPPGSVRRRLPDVQRLYGWGFRPRVELRAGLERCWAARRS